MRYPIVAVALVAIAVLGMFIYQALTAPPPPPPPVGVQSIASNLQTIWSLAFAPDGRLFVAERPGRIRVIKNDQLQREPWATIPVYEKRGFEAGLMGMTVDPEFESNRRVYICFTEPARTSLALPTTNTISVLTENSGKGSALTTLVTGIVAGPFHDGCRLKFGPDGKLYASTGDGSPNGDRARGDRAQSLDSLNGKILRLNRDGSIPADNPFPHSYIWSYGHRNVQGLAFQPATGALFATEHGTGPTGFGNDEVNLIRPGNNYGWPKAVGHESHIGFISPLSVFDDPPAGATFVTSELYPGLSGTLLIGTLGSHRMLGMVFTDGPTPTNLRTDIFFDKTLGRIRDVVQGPDGYIYIGTSNRDGRNGKPTAEDDHIYRVLSLTSPTPASQR
jgi:glucose/arabinose dehydrogenase